jgi:hypothetical protein
MSTKKVMCWIAGAIATSALFSFAYLAWILTQPGATSFASGTPVLLAAWTKSSPTGAPKEISQSDIISRGRYLTAAADCEACHTAKNGVPFSGGRPFALPFGTLYTPNITPDLKTGIGSWSDAQFLQAVHKGIGRNGKRLYPAFPYASFTMLTDNDVLSKLKHTYFL